MFTKSSFSINFTNLANNFTYFGEISRFHESGIALHCRFDEISLNKVFVFVFVDDSGFGRPFALSTKTSAKDGRKLPQDKVYMFDVGSDHLQVLQNGCKYTQDSTTLLCSINFIALNSINGCCHGQSGGFGGLFTK